MTLWFIVIIPIVVLAFVFAMTSCSAQQRLLRDIQRHRVSTLWWLHKKKSYKIECTSETTAKRPNNANGEYNTYSAILLSNFWQDGHYKKSDMFLVKKLYLKNPIQTSSL